MANQLKGYEKRKREARAFWSVVVDEYNGGVYSNGNVRDPKTPTEIATSHINPKTGKHYTREHIHWILKNADKL